MTFYLSERPFPQLNIPKSGMKMQQNNIESAQVLCKRQPVIKHLRWALCPMLMTWWWAEEMQPLPAWHLPCSREADIKLIIAHLSLQSIINRFFKKLV